MPRTLFLSTLTALLIGACGGGGDDPTPTPGPTPVTDATAAVQQALANLNALPSYHLDITLSPIGAPLVFYVDIDRGNFFERIPNYAGTEDDAEFIFYGDFTYRRDCRDSGQCGEWQSEAGRPVIPNLAGTGSSVPETLGIVLIENAEELSITDPVALEMTGTVDLGAAIEDNLRRAFTAAGRTPEEIEDAITEFRGGSGIAPGSSSRVEITLTPDARYIQNLIVFTPGQLDNPYFESAYSQFGTATVSPPEGFS